MHRVCRRMPLISSANVISTAVFFLMRGEVSRMNAIPCNLSIPRTWFLLIGGRSVAVHLISTEQFSLQARFKAENLNWKSSMHVVYNMNLFHRRQAPQQEKQQQNSHWNQNQFPKRRGENTTNPKKKKKNVMPPIVGDRALKPVAGWFRSTNAFPCNRGNRVENIDFLPSYRKWEFSASLESGSTIRWKLEQCFLSHTMHLVVER